jgi:hypothetical protein
LCAVLRKEKGIIGGWRRVAGSRGGGVVRWRRQRKRKGVIVLQRREGVEMVFPRNKRGMASYHGPKSDKVGRVAHDLLNLKT